MVPPGVRFVEEGRYVELEVVEYGKVPAEYECRRHRDDDRRQDEVPVCAVLCHLCVSVKFLPVISILDLQMHSFDRLSIYSGIGQKPHVINPLSYGQLPKVSPVKIPLWSKAPPPSFREKLFKNNVFNSTNIYCVSETK